MRNHLETVITNYYLNIVESQVFTPINPLSANFTKWSNTLKQFVGFGRQIVWVYLTILQGWCLKG